MSQSSCRRVIRKLLPAGMKHTFLALFALTACVASALAQTSPASAASGSLTKEERATAINYLKETEKNFLAAIDGVSDAQWEFKAAPERWSIAQTAERVFATLKPDEQAGCQDLMLRLSAIGDGAETTRRRVLFSELSSPHGAAVDPRGRYSSASNP